MRAPLPALFLGALLTLPACEPSTPPPTAQAPDLPPAVPTAQAAPNSDIQVGMPREQVDAQLTGPTQLENLRSDQSRVTYFPQKFALEFKNDKVIRFGTMADHPDVGGDYRFQRLSAPPPPKRPD